jgi:hypothetical protein
MEVTRVPGVPRIRLVVAFDKEGAVRPVSVRGTLPLPATRGLTDSMLELVGRRDNGGAGLRERDP